MEGPISLSQDGTAVNAGTEKEPPPIRHAAELILPAGKWYAIMAYPPLEFKRAAWIIAVCTCFFQALI
jgi:hypothetical protein